MLQLTVRLSAEVIESLDKAARALHRSRSEIVRQAIDRCLHDCHDFTVAAERLWDHADPLLNWDELKAVLLREDY